MEDSNLRHFLSDTFKIVREQADDARARATSPDGNDFDRGESIAYHSVLHLVISQAEAFGISANAIGLEGLDPDRYIV